MYLYKFFNKEDDVVYVGVSVNVKNRFRDHKVLNGIGKDIIKRIEVGEVASSYVCRLLEVYLIGRYVPMFNRDCIYPNEESINIPNIECLLPVFNDYTVNTKRHCKKSKKSKKELCLLISEYANLEYLDSEVKLKFCKEIFINTLKKKYRNTSIIEVSAVNERLEKLKIEYEIRSKRVNVNKKQLNAWYLVKINTKSNQNSKSVKLIEEIKQVGVDINELRSLWLDRLRENSSTLMSVLNGVSDEDNDDKELYELWSNELKETKPSPMSIKLFDDIGYFLLQGYGVDLTLELITMGKINYGNFIRTLKDKEENKGLYKCIKEVIGDNENLTTVELASRVVDTYSELLYKGQLKARTVSNAIGVYYVKARVRVDGKRIRCLTREKTEEELVSTFFNNEDSIKQLMEKEDDGIGIFNF